MMKKLKQILMGAVLCSIVSVGALAQKQDPKPPPKEGDQPRVKVEDKKDPPPDRGQKNDDKKKP